VLTAGLRNYRKKKNGNLSAIARGPAHAASSGSCLDTLAAVSGEGGSSRNRTSVARAMLRHVYTRIHIAHGNDTLLLIACLTIGRTQFSFLRWLRHRPQSLYIYDYSRTRVHAGLNLSRPAA